MPSFNGGLNNHQVIKARLYVTQLRFYSLPTGIQLEGLIFIKTYLSELWNCVRETQSVWNFDSPFVPKFHNAALFDVPYNIRCHKPSGSTIEEIHLICKVLSRILTHAILPLINPCCPYTKSRCLCRRKYHGSKIRFILVERELAQKQAN